MIGIADERSAFFHPVVLEPSCFATPGPSAAARRYNRQQRCQRRTDKGKTLARVVFGIIVLNSVFRKMRTSGRMIGSSDFPIPGSVVSSMAEADLRYYSFGCSGSLSVMQYSVAAITDGTDTNDSPEDCTAERKNGAARQRQPGHGWAESATL